MCWVRIWYNYIVSIWRRLGVTYAVWPLLMVHRFQSSGEVNSARFFFSSVRSVYYSLHFLVIRSLRVSVIRSWSSLDCVKFFTCLNTRLSVYQGSGASPLLFTKRCYFHNISSVWIYTKLCDFHVSPSSGFPQIPDLFLFLGVPGVPWNQQFGSVRH